jgi:hypothetical protein
VRGFVYSESYRESLGSRVHSNSERVHMNMREFRL